MAHVRPWTSTQHARCFPRSQAILIDCRFATACRACSCLPTIHGTTQGPATLVAAFVVGRVVYAAIVSTQRCLRLELLRQSQLAWSLNPWVATSGRKSPDTASRRPEWGDATESRTTELPAAGFTASVARDVEHAVITVARSIVPQLLHRLAAAGGSLARLIGVYDGSETCKC